MGKNSTEPTSRRDRSKEVAMAGSYTEKKPRKHNASVADMEPSGGKKER